MLLVAIAFPTGVIAISGACELPRGCNVDFDFKFGGVSTMAIRTTVRDGEVAKAKGSG